MNSDRKRKEKIVESILQRIERSKRLSEGVKRGITPRQRTVLLNSSKVTKNNWR